MFTQKHEDEMPQGDQRSSPVEEKQTATSSEGRSKQAPPSLPRWIAVLFSIFGIVLPLVAGSMVNWPWGIKELDNGTVFNMVVLAMGVSVAVGVVLLYFAFRARWTCLLAPFAWLVGEFVYGVIDHYELQRQHTSLNRSALPPGPKCSRFAFKQNSPAACNVTSR